MNFAARATCAMACLPELVSHPGLTHKAKFSKNIPLSASKFASYFGNFSIKHDLARSCFQLWPKIGDEGDKISRKKLARRLSVSASKFASYFGNFKS